MKYRTVIELVCEASDKEDASNVAGDYLKGDLDFGVDMTCKTTKLSTYSFKKYALSCVLVFFVFLTFLLNVTPVGSYVAPRQETTNFSATSTVKPSLRTRYDEDFKERWIEEKENVIQEKSEME